MFSSAATVDLAGRTVSRLGVSLIELRTRGMWGEPADREAAVATILRAAELGAGPMEVPVPFGPAADLVRQVGSQDAYMIARLTSDEADLDVLEARLGRRPDMVVAPERLLDQMAGWGIAVGVLVGAQTHRVGHRPLTAVRGPSPPEAVVRWYEAEGITYMASALSILEAGALTVALPVVTSVRDVERVFAEAATPPAGGPG